MFSFQSKFAIGLAAIIFLLTSTIEARCHNLSSAAYSHCPQYSGGSRTMVRASATAPVSMKALATGVVNANAQAKGQQQEAAVNAQENSPTDTSADATPWMYGNEANQTLPKPSATLMTVALGIGTQNYSCPSAPSATPSQVGATARLYHLNKPSEPVTDVPIAGLPAIGMHYFNAAGTPSFQFFDNGTLGLLQAAKKVQIPAPAGAGVPWLQLVSTGTGQGNLQEVYRVQTKGGSPVPGFCNGKAAGTRFEVPYRAQYWFYGSGP